MNCQLALKALVNNWLNSDQICLLCSELAEQTYPLCHPCENELPWLIDACQRCALPMPASDMICADCRRRAPAFTTVVVPWHYAFPVDSVISRFKHHRQWPLGRLLALLLSQNLRHRFEVGLPRPQLLLPVPLAKRRLRMRGFNQAAMLARWLSSEIQVPCSEHWLTRCRDTPAQQTIGARARRRNLRDAFGLTAAAKPAGRHVAIIDDVLTTGSTAQALAALLRRAGAQRVDIYCLARTPMPAHA
ncbi:ComF family protein [Pseudomonas cremoricolorata]|uniref:Amidophosphoribosyltransferase n=1 Tax=Pseudomonas cremoricolorata TaxID=157783 RepID=A0A089WIL8_9PSED|nr:ComF family protein [Pseudomonas cremoricolorata]AIR88451.1 amidophosphoribosyltransferase [Pseudomonas cremoricolorata]